MWVAYLPERVKLGPLGNAVFARLVLADEVVVHSLPIDQRQCIGALLLPGSQPGGGWRGCHPYNHTGPLPRGALLLRPQFPHTRPMGSAPQSLMEKWQGLRELRSGPTQPPDLLVTGRAWGWRRGCWGEQRGEWPCSQSSKGRYVAIHRGILGHPWWTFSPAGPDTQTPTAAHLAIRGEHLAIRWAAPGPPWLNTRPPMVGHLATGVGRGGTW